MTVVVDASVAVKWVVSEADSELAATLRDRLMLAPPLWLVECAAALARREKAGELSSEGVDAALDLLRAFPVVGSEHSSDLPAALRLAARLRHPLYDCLYLAVARREGCKLITADAEFVRAVRRAPDLADGVVLLSDYEPDAAG